MEVTLSSAAIAVMFMLILGLLLAGILAIASQRLFVYEDPRIDDVEEMLPHANCGACGTAGCRAFAEKLVQGELQPGKCTVNSADMNAAIATFLGVELGAEEKRVARLACAGGIHVAQQFFVTERNLALRMRACWPWPLRRVGAPDVHL